MLYRQLCSAQDSNATVINFGLDQKISYGSLQKEINNTAASLHKMGVGSGDRVLVQNSDLFSYLVGVFSASKIGAIFIPIDHDASPLRLKEIFSQTLPSAYIQSLNNIEYIKVKNDLSFETDGIAGIFFSSGSTGVPKGIPLSHDNLLYVAKELANICDLKENHNELLIARPTHMDGWQRITATLYAGGTISPRRAMSASMLLQELNISKANGLYIPPFIASSMPCSIPDFSSTSLRVVELGSAAIASNILSSITSSAPQAKVLYHYGLTECSRATILDVKKDINAIHSCGSPLPHVAISIRNSHGQEIPSGEAGEIWLTGPQLAKSYWNDAKLNREKYQDKWFKTGDIGSVDPNGFLYFQGRADDLLCNKGFHFYPAEAEKELASILGIQNFAYASNSDKYNPELLLFLEEGASLHFKEKIAEKISQSLSPIYHPDKIIFIEKIPRTSSGKIDRNTMHSLHKKS